MAVLEDPDERAERRRQRQHVHHHRLDRQHHRAEGQEQQHERRADDEQPHPRQRPTEAGEQVAQLGRPAADQHLGAGRRGHGADLGHQAGAPRCDTPVVAVTHRDQRGAALRLRGHLGRRDAGQPGQPVRRTPSSAAVGASRAAPKVTTGSIGVVPPAGKSASSVSATTRLSVPGRQRPVRRPRRTPPAGTGSPATQQHRHDHGDVGHRAAHDAVRQPGPGAVASRPRRRRADACGARQRDAQRVDPGAEHGRAAPAARSAPPTIATSTAAMPPKPIDRRKTCGKSSSEASEIATVRPENATVRPAVRHRRGRAPSSTCSARGAAPRGTG